MAFELRTASVKGMPAAVEEFVDCYGVVRRTSEFRLSD